MYVQCTKKLLIKDIITKIVVFLTVVGPFSCSSAWAEITLSVSWGQIHGVLTDGNLGGDGLPIALASFDDAASIDTTPLSNGVSYDMDGDDYEESSTESEVGLFYAEAYADVIQSGVVYREWGESIAIGSASFSSDSSQFSLHWEYERSPYDFGFVNNSYSYIYDLETLDYVWNWDCIYYPAEGTETVELTPGRGYSVVWGVDVGAGWGFDHDGWARLTLDLQDVVLPSPSPDIDVSPTSHDFGIVEVGSTNTTIVTISNVGYADLAINSLIFSSGSSSSVSVTSPSSLPATISPGGTLDVEIVFAPSSDGSSLAVLEIGSDDPDEPSVQVSLSGMGIVFEIPPLEQIAEILECFDECSVGGDLVGEGDGNSADNRLNALRNMLEEAAGLIGDGFYAEACEQLNDAYKKCDGNSKPPDFVSGSATAVLAEMILDAIENLGCEYY